MATMVTAYGRLRDQMRDYQRAAGELLAGPGLWLLIVGLVIWSATSERQLLVVGIVVGSILTLGALGLTLIYGILKFGNFAHGDAMMTGAYVAFFALTGRMLSERRDAEVLPWSLGDLPGARDAMWDFSFGYGLVLATVVAMVVIAAVSVGLDRLVYRPLRRRRSGIVIFAIASLGVAIALRSTMLIFWGPDPRVYVKGIRPTTELPFDIRIVTDQIFMFAAAASITALVYILLFRTKLGKAMRAMADNPDLARVSGIDTDRVITWTWVMGGALMGIAGVLLALQVQLNPQLGFVLILPLFASAILGGIGSPHGALVGAMVVGITQEVSVGIDLSVFGWDVLPLEPEYKFSVVSVSLVLNLLVRPRGLFGERA